MVVQINISGKIDYLFEGKNVESIFDMWVYYHDGYEGFIEVKHSHELDPSNPKTTGPIR